MILARISVVKIFASGVTVVGLNTLLAMSGWAATLSSSEVTFTLTNFSDLPANVSASTVTNTNAESINGAGVVESNANANATFLTDQSGSSQANMIANSEVRGEGRSYAGTAEGLARVNGFSFLIQAGETFSFDFHAVLNLKTAVDAPDIEQAAAIGTLFLGLYDTADETYVMPLEQLTISGNVESSGQNDGLTVNQSTGITFASSQTALNSVLDNHERTASASIQGTLSRYFASPISLTLGAYSLSQSIVSAPEPSNVLAIALLASALGIKAMNGVLKRSIDRTQRF